MTRATSSRRGVRLGAESWDDEAIDMAPTVKVTGPPWELDLILVVLAVL